MAFDAHGDANAVFVIRGAGVFAVSAAATTMHLLNRTNANYIYWVINGAGAADAGAFVTGRVMSVGGAVTLAAETGTTGATTGSNAGGTTTTGSTTTGSAMGSTSPASITALLCTAATYQKELWRRPRRTGSGRSRPMSVDRLRTHSIASDPLGCPAIVGGSVGGAQKSYFEKEERGL